MTCTCTTIRFGTAPKNPQSMQSQLQAIIDWREAKRLELIAQQDLAALPAKVEAILAIEAEREAPNAERLARIERLGEMVR